MTTPSITRARLADNKPISAFTFWQAKRLRERIAREVEDRRAYVEANGLDPKFCYGDANWSDDPHVNDYGKAYRHVRDGGRDVLDRLLFFAQAFSGYSLQALKPNDGSESVRPIPDDYDAWIERERPDPDIPVTESVVPRRYRYAPPLMLGQVGWIYKGELHNFDAMVYRERINLMWEAGLLDRLRALPHKARILEIGGGYGALASALKGMVGAAEYVICDLPESLMFSGLYLRMTKPAARVRVAGRHYVPGSGFTLLPNYKFHQLLDAGAGFDLIVNTISMSEMSEHQVHAYARGIQRLLGDRGVFYEQNVPPGHPGAVHYCKDVLAEYLEREDVVTKQFKATQGIATLWTNGSRAPVDASAA